MHFTKLSSLFIVLVVGMYLSVNKTHSVFPLTCALYNKSHLFSVLMGRSRLILSAVESSEERNYFLSKH